MTVKKTFWLLLLVFVLPIVLGSALFWLKPHFFSQSVNYGQLVKPVLPVSTDGIAWQGQMPTEKPPVFAQQWTLLYVSSGCEANCLAQLKLIDSIYLLTNDNIKRFQKVFLFADMASAPDVLRQNRWFVGQLNQDSVLFDPQWHNQLLLVDPLGNLMMRYAFENIAVKKVLKDLKRLLRYSRVG